ncbi:MAG: FkbM family methyltransferase [Deltaproteobacteria bacterium]|nr:FkbM family methyltransferase [Deltaproteobacteria bacterium]
MHKLFKLLYNTGLLTPHQKVDRLRYLKRLAKGRKHPADIWYFSERDLPQYGREVLFRTEFRGQPVWFLCDREHHVEWNILRQGLHEARVLERMADLARPGTLVVEAGGNIGAHSIPLARALPGVEIHSYEPNPLALARFRRNLELNPCPNLRVIPAGLGETPGQARFFALGGRAIGQSSFLAPRGDYGRGEEIEVPVCSLDQVSREWERPLGLLKMDVQGFEARVLAGGAQTIAQHRPPIILEHEDSNFASPAEASRTKGELAAFFEAHDYRVFCQFRERGELFFPVRWDQPLESDLLALPAGSPPPPPPVPAAG